MEQFQKSTIFVQDSYEEISVNDYNRQNVENEYTSQNQVESEIDGQNFNPTTTNFNFQKDYSTNGNSQKKKQKLSSKFTTIINTSQTMQKTNQIKLDDEISNFDEEPILGLPDNFDKQQNIKKSQKRNNTKQNQRKKKVYDNGKILQKVRKRKQKQDEMNQSIKQVNQKKKYKQDCYEKPEKNMKSYFKRLLPKKIDYPRNRKQHILDCMNYLKSFKVLHDILSSKQLINVQTPIELLPKFYADNRIELEKIDR